MRDGVTGWIVLLSLNPSCMDCIKEKVKDGMELNEARNKSSITTGQTATDGNIWLCMLHFRKRQKEVIK